MAQQRHLERNRQVSLGPISPKIGAKVYRDQSYRKVSWTIMKIATGSAAILHLVAILAIFHIFTLTYLSQGFHQINF